MKIHEYQAKQVFARYGIPVPKGEPAFKVEDVGPIAERLIAETKIPVVVVKAQIHAGGRGKGGGVKVAKGGAKEAVELATLEWVSWFNHHRLLEPIGYIPPAEAEANYYRQLTSQATEVAA